MSRFKLEDVLAVTDGHQQQGDGSYMVICPAHDDRKPSLHVTPDGKYALLHCFVCEYKQVAQALESLGAKNGVASVKIRFSKVDVQGFADYCRVDPAFLKSLHPDLLFGQDWVGFAFPSGVVKKRIQGEKDFKWEPDGDRPPLWPMPPQSLPDTIYLTAGETDCICLRAAGFTAFALTKGEGSTPPVAVFETLKAQGVSTICYAADVDAAGRKAIPQLLAVAEDARVTLQVIDLTPHLNPLLGEKDVRSLTRRVGVSKMRELIEAASNEVPDAWARQIDQIIDANQGEMPWVVKPLIAKGEVTLIAGFPKAGKTTFTYRMAEKMREGGIILETLHVSKAGVLIWSERSDRINAKRAEALFRGVAQPHIHFVTRFDKQFRNRPFEEKLRMVMQEAQRRAKDILIIDPLASLAGIEDENSASEVQPFLDLLSKQAQKFDIAVVVIHHFNKSGKIRGSGTFEAEPSTLIEIKGEYQEPRTLKLRSNIETKVPDEIIFTLDDKGDYQLSTGVETPEAQQVLSVLSAQLSDAKTLTELLDELKESREDKVQKKYQRTIDRLIRAGKAAWTPVKRTGRGQKNPRGYYLVAEVQVTRV